MRESDRRFTVRAYDGTSAPSTDGKVDPNLRMLETDAPLQP
jgi:hypothetical protein